MPEPTWKIEHGPRDELPWWEDHAKLKLFGSIFVVFSICGVIWYAYFSDSNPRRIRDNGALIIAEKGTNRIRPKSPGGYSVPHQDKTVLETRKIDRNAQGENVAAAPEAPIDMPLHDTLTKTEGAKKEKAAVPEKIQPLVDTATLNADKWSPRKSLHSKAQEADRVVIKGVPAKGTSAPSTLKTPGIPKPLSPLNGKSDIRDPYAKNTQPETKKVPAHSRTKAASSEQKPLAPVQDANASKKPVPVTKTAPAVKMAPGTYRVQLASLKTEEKAGRAWQMAAKKHSALKNVPHAVVKADLGAKGVYYRVQVGSFKSKSDANALCQTLQGEKASCYVVKG